MKKFLIYVFTILIVAQSQTIASDTITAGMKQSVFATILETITGKINTPSNSVASGMVNNVKLTAYKKQLELKRQELQEVESSSAICFVKWYKKYTITKKMNEIQNQIDELEIK